MQRLAEVALEDALLAAREPVEADPLGYCVGRLPLRPSSFSSVSRSAGSLRAVLTDDQVDDVGRQENAQAEESQHCDRDHRRDREQ